MFLLSLFAVPAVAVPPMLHHQGRVLDASGAPLTGFQTVHVALYDAATGGSLVWSDDPTVEFDDGYFTVELGTSIDAPLADDAFDGASLWFELAVAQGAPLPRQRLVSVPFARRAGLAEGVADGLVLDVAELRVDGATVIDGTGALVGTGDGDTLADLACTSGEVASWTGTAWACATHDVRTDSDVLAVIASAPVDLPSGSTLDGAALATGDHDWDVLLHVPADLANGDDLERLGSSCADGELPSWIAATSTWGCVTDRVLDGAEVRDRVAEAALDLDAGTTIGGASISTGSHLTAGDVTALIQTTSLDVDTLPADGLDEISNGVLSVDADDVTRRSTPVLIPDANPLGVVDRLDVPDLGPARAVTVQVALTSSDISGVTLRLVAADATVLVLYDGADTGTTLDASFGDDRAIVSGDLSAWNDRNPAGEWTLQAVDATDDGLSLDGQIDSWSVTAHRLSADTVTVSSTLVAPTVQAQTFTGGAASFDDVTVSGSLGFSSLTGGSATFTSATVGGVDVGAHLVPAGAVLMFNLAACPSGWSVLSQAAGRYPVGLTTGGALLSTVGTALSDGENRAVGRHSHAITDPGHSHRVAMDADTDPDGGSGSCASEDTDDRGLTTGTSTTGITMGDAGTVDGTNAPYVQLLFCQKD